METLCDNLGWVILSEIVSDARQFCGHPLGLGLEANEKLEIHDDAFEVLNRL